MTHPPHARCLAELAIYARRGFRRVDSVQWPGKRYRSVVLNKDLQEGSMLVNKAADRAWQATDHPGIERSLFRNNETGGRSSVVRLAKGSRFPRHAHQGTEEVVVLAGIVTIGGVELASGDYLFTSPGEEHDVSALTDAIIFVSSQKATPLVE